MYDSVTDYETAGQNKLSFSRFYNSFNLPNTYAVTLGQNWRSNYDHYLHFISADYVLAERPDGQLIGFTSSSGVWVTDPDINVKLTNSGSNWLLTDPSDTVETYFASGSQGLLSSIKLRNGYTQNLAYSSSTGSLSTVTDSYNRSLNLSYSSSTGMLTSVTTPDSLSLSYGYLAYTSANTQLLSSVSYNTSPVTQQQYLYQNSSFPYALTGIVDENGIQFSSWSYDSQGRATSSLNYGSANLVSVSYDDTTGNRTVTNALGNQETYKFTASQGASKVSEIDRASSATFSSAYRFFTYDTNGFLATSTDWDGNQTAYTNNSAGHPTTIVFASGSAVSHTTTIAYDTTWPNLPKTITEPGLTTVNNYDATTGNLLTKVETDTTTQSIPYSTNGQSRTWTLTYTSTGQIASIQLPRTDVTAKTTLAYASGTLTSITDALSHVTTINTYTGGGYPTKITDQNSVVSTQAYTPRLWFTSGTLFTTAGNLTTTLAYDSAGNLTKTTLPDSTYLAYAYDGAHRLTTITNPLSETVNYTLNGLGNTTQTLIKYSSGSTSLQHSGTFDVLGRTHTNVGGMSQTTTYGYDGEGNVTSILDPLSNSMSQAFDQLNRLTTYTDANGNNTGFTYDAHNRPLTVVDAKGNTTSYVYDGFGDTIQVSSPDSNTTVYYYDPDGNVSSKTDANGYVTNWTYDALDRPLTRKYPADSTLNVAYTYDQATGHGSGIGRLTSLTDQSGSLSLSYDQRGNLTNTGRVFSTPVHSTSWTYDSASHVQSITFNAGWIEAYTRQTGHRVRKVNAVLQHPTLPFMLANIDREVVGNRDVQLLECKTAGEFGARLWRDGVPEYVQLQVQHQLAVMGRQAVDVAVLLCGQKLEVHRVIRDNALIARLIELEAAFWRYVETDTPPPADGSESADRALRCLYPGAGGTVDFTGDRSLSSTFSALVAVRAEIDSRQVVESKLKQTIQQAMGEADRAEFETGSVSFRRSRDSSGIDLQRLLTDHPELAAQYAVTKAGTRRFLVNA